jgi:hypothetical protein
MACGQASDNETDHCCEGAVAEDNKAYYERKARAGDLDAMRGLSHYYSTRVPGYDPNTSQLLFVKGDDADKARYWAELSIEAGNRTFLGYYIRDYIEQSRDTNLAISERRLALIQALWVSQRLPSEGGNWQRYSNTMTEKIDRQKLQNLNQLNLQEIIFAMRDLENEAAKVN